MKRKVFDYFEICGKLAVQSSERDQRKSFLLASIGIRKDGAMVRAVNSGAFLPTIDAHSEWRLCKRLDLGTKEVYVARIRLLNGEFAMARPCDQCYRALWRKRVEKIYYTISQKEFGCIDFIRDTEVIRDM